MTLILLCVCVFAWWAQRDAFRLGRELGRLEERREALERLEPKPRHLRLVKP